MASAHANQVLSRVLTRLSRSFPAYVSFAPPWARPGDEHALAALKQMAADQQVLAERVSQAIQEGGGMPRLGEFPMEFTGLHDLGVDFLLRQAVAFQERDVAELAECVDALRLAPAVRPLAEEALGLAKGHLETLRELAGQPV